MDLVSGTFHITDLSSNTKYEICGLYLVMSTGMWSPESSSITFTTLDTTNDMETVTTVFAYWFRTVCSSVYMNTSQFVDVVTKYYHFTPRFEWNELKKHEDIQLSSDRMKFHCSGADFKMRAITSRNVVTAGPIVTWEVRCISSRCKEPEARQEVSFCMGFCNIDDIGDFDVGNRVNGRNRNETSLYLVDGRFPRSHRKSSSYDPSIFQKWNFESETGKLEFNFETNECQAFVNSEFVGLVSNHLPNKLYLAVSFWHADVSFETTLFVTQ